MARATSLRLLEQAEPMKQVPTSSSESEAAPAAVELDTGDATQEEIDAAATKMQATWKGKQARKDIEAKKAASSSGDEAAAAEAAAAPVAAAEEAPAAAEEAPAAEA